MARVEALIAGWGMEEAPKRARAYADAGADATLFIVSPGHLAKYMSLLINGIIKHLWLLYRQNIMMLLLRSYRKKGFQW